MKALFKLKLPKGQRWRSPRLNQIPWKTWRFRDQSLSLKTHLTFASGLIFGGVLLAQAIPGNSLRVGKSPDVVTAQAGLWQSTGAVRQSIVELYRARRVLIESGTLAVSPSGVADPADSAQTGPSSQSGATASTLDQAADTTASAASHQPAKPAVAHLPHPPAATQIPTNFDPSKTIDTNLEMRVAIAQSVPSLAVGLSADGYLMDIDGQNYCNLPAQTSYIARPAAQGIDFGGCQLSSAVWLEPADSGYVYVGDSWYKGRVLLLNDGGRLMAVNFVLLLDYLSSVVGSEMYPQWPSEALKAQAVAARSYALTQHVRNANRPFDLDNTQRYQAYLGIAKETNTTQAAVMQTTGEFISFQGGIVESLYAASDEIVKAAHGGNGMSQNGAKDLASNGLTYTEILGTYYPGTSLSRLVINSSQ